MIRYRKLTTCETISVNIGRGRAGRIEPNIPAMNQQIKHSNDWAWMRSAQEASV